MMGEGDAAKPELMTVQANVSWLLSRWSCIYGMGCPSIMSSSIDNDTACCQIGTGFESDLRGHSADDDFNRVSAAVEQLTPEDCDNIELVRTGKWWYDEDLLPVDDGPIKRKHTKVVKGACVFQNRTMGPANKMGCALHHLANRLGVHPSETKPTICWSVPYGVSVDQTEDGVWLCIVDYTRAETWGDVHNDAPGNRIGWFCTEDTRAFHGSDPVYKSGEHELRLMLGDYVYEQLRAKLEEIEAQRGDQVSPVGAYQKPRETVVFIADTIRRWDDNGRAGRQAFKHSSPAMIEIGRQAIRKGL